MVDLSKLKAGDFVKFRSGGYAEVSRVTSADNNYSYTVFYGGGNGWYYKPDGHFASNDTEEPFDIIEILDVDSFINKASPVTEQSETNPDGSFNWPAMKVGAAFVWDYETVYFAGLGSSDGRPFFSVKGQASLQYLRTSNMFREASQDINY